MSPETLGLEPIKATTILTIYVDRFGAPCDSSRHDARPLRVIAEATVERLRAAVGSALDYISADIDSDDPTTDQAFRICDELREALGEAEQDAS